MTVYKSDSCGCCGDWVEHMRKAGYAIRVVSTDDLIPVKSRLGCHTAVVDGKAIEGHVPAAAISAFPEIARRRARHRRGRNADRFARQEAPATPPKATRS